MTDDTPGLGHNRPPIEAYDKEALEALEARANQYADAGAEWESTEVSDAEQASRLADYINGARGLSADIEAARKREKAPWIEAGKSVDAAYKKLSAGLELALGAAKRRQTDWLTAERDRARQRLAAEKAAADAAADAADAEREAAVARGDMMGQAAAEAAAKEAAAAAAKLQRKKATARAQGQAGRSQSLRTRRKAKIANPLVAFMQFKNHRDVVDLLERLAAAELRAGKETVPGFVIELVEEAA